MLVLQKCRSAAGSAQGLGFVSCRWIQVTLQLRTLGAAAPDVAHCCCCKAAVIPEQLRAVICFVRQGGHWRRDPV